MEQRFAPTLALDPALRSMLERLLDAPPTALLLTGPRGAGKYTLASAFARAVLCRSKGARPCERCHACVVADEELITLTDPERAPISVAQAAELRGTSAARMTTLSYLFVVVEAVDQLHPAAANMLLKTLEEPAPHVRFVLTADRRARVLPTIRSRCQLVRVGRAADAALAAVLRERSDLVADAPDRLRAGDGLPGRTASLFDATIWEHALSRRSRLQVIARGDPVTRFEQAAAALKEGTPLEMLDDLVAELARTLRGEPGTPFTAAPSALARAMLACLRARGLLERGARPQLALENALLQLP